MSGRVHRTGASSDRSSADRGLGTLPTQTWTLHPPTAGERARARSILATFSRDGDELRELLDMLDLWPDAAELHASRRARARRTASILKERTC